MLALSFVCYLWTVFVKQICDCFCLCSVCNIDVRYVLCVHYFCIVGSLCCVLYCFTVCILCAITVVPYVRCYTLFVVCFYCCTILMYCVRSIVVLCVHCFVLFCCTLSLCIGVIIFAPYDDDMYCVLYCCTIFTLYCVLYIVHNALLFLYLLYID